MDQQGGHDEPGTRPIGPTPTDNPARFGAPLPPPSLPAWPTGPTVSAAGAPATSKPPRRRGPRLLVLGLALVVLALAAGAGFALGRVSHPAPPSAGADPGQSPNGPGFGGSPFGNTDPFGRTPSDGPGRSGGSPFGSATEGVPASRSQLTGLVRIASTLKYQGGRAAGTGMILTSTGEVITNHHVVQGSTDLRVTVMSTGRSYRATVVGTDAKDDVAVLQLDHASGLQTITPDTDQVEVGDAVTAVGDANGNTKTFTAAAGKVLATGRSITTSNELGRPGERLHGLVEIGSEVISGDSGGATYDAEGEVLGMTTAASTGSRDVVGYAIPIAKGLGIAGDLENGTQNARYEYGSPAFLGIGLAGSSSRIGTVYAGTPAARAGLAAGDAITRVGGSRVSTAAQLRDAVTGHSPGNRVQLAWTDQDGSTHTATVTLMAGPVA
jgi:S1-C subfamily serine protease